MRFLRRSLLGLFWMSLTVALLVWAVVVLRDAFAERSAGGGYARPAQEQLFAVNVIRVEPKTIKPVLTTFGEIRSHRTLEVRAVSGGAVVELSENFEEGGTVSGGELLAAIDPSDAQAALATAQNDLADAQAGVNEAERALEIAEQEAEAAKNQASLQSRALERARDLAERGVGSVAAVEAAELSDAQAAQTVLSRVKALAQAEASLDQARNLVSRRMITLTEAERALERTRITAEFSGVLANVSAVKGGLVTPNERLARLIDPTALEVSFRLSTSQYARLLGADGALQGASVEAVLEVLGADLVATGEITRESGAVADGQTGRLLFASLEGAAGFRPGDFVTVRITEPALANTAILPANAFDGSGTVLAIGEGNRLEVLPATILRRQGDDVIVSASGLEGREVVGERSPFLGAGILVRPIRPGAEAEASEPEMIELTPERRAALIAFVEANTRMPDEAKARVLAQLNEAKVPVEVVSRIESRMGG